MDTKVDVQYKDGGVSMKGVPQGRYTKEFREEAVKLIIQEGLSLPDAAIDYHYPLQH
jgi:transposase-like protein